MKAIIKFERNEFAKKNRKLYEKGQIKIKRKEAKRMAVRNDGISNTLTTLIMDNMLYEDCNFMEEEKKVKTPRPEGKGWCWDEDNGKWFRIRKLTPRECFRLMDVRDEDFDKLLVIESYDKKGNPRRAISDSQLYKMAGNSIVVSCMDLIFENLFFPKKRENTLF